MTRPLNTYLLNINYRSPDPKLAADVANAVANQFVQHTYDIKMKNSGSLSVFIEKNLEELKARMEKSSEALAAFEKEMNVINPEQKTSITVERIKNLIRNTLHAKAERVKKEADS